MVAPEIVGLEEEEDAAAGLVANEGSCCGVEARARRSEVPFDPGGATRTQRLSCSGW
jgi:hypothetical protein